MKKATPAICANCEHWEHKPSKMTGNRAWGECPCKKDKRGNNLPTRWDMTCDQIKLKGEQKENG